MFLWVPVRQILFGLHMSIFNWKARQVCALAIAGALCIATAPAKADAIQLGFILDRSGSIGAGDWNMIVDGLAQAVGNIPVGGGNTYEVSVVSFASSASIDIANILVDSLGARTSLASQIAALGNGRSNDVYIGGNTNYADAFSKMQDALDNTILGLDSLSYVNFATDGDPTAGGLGNVSDNQAGINARNALILAGVNNISIEGISINTAGANNLKDRFCYPLACDATSPYNFPDVGFYIPVNGAAGYAAAIGNKIKIVTGQPVPEPQVIALFGIGLLAFVPAMRRRYRLQN